jgi:D-aminopeptidase
VLINAAVDETTLIRCAVAAHDGIARTIWPSHTLVDGDVVFVSALETGEPSVQETLTLSIATEMAIERAVHDAITA